jgi:hypothetical protein
MPKDWIYVLQCLNHKWYVGTTTRLFTRLNEHIKQQGKGSNFTQQYTQIKLVGLYEFDPIIYNHANIISKEDLETKLTLHMKHINGHINICGGEYDYRHYKDSVEGNVDNPLKYGNLNMRYRPECMCGFPAELKAKKNGDLYYTCCVKYIYKKLQQFLEDVELDYDTPCKFFMNYNEFKYVDKSGICRKCGNYIKNTVGYDNICYTCNNNGNSIPRLLRNINKNNNISILQEKLSSLLITFVNNTTEKIVDNLCDKYKSLNKDEITDIFNKQITFENDILCK